MYNSSWTVHVHQDLWTEHHRGSRTSGLNVTGNIEGLVTELTIFTCRRYIVLRPNTASREMYTYSVTRGAHVAFVVVEKQAIKDEPNT